MYKEAKTVCDRPNNGRQLPSFQRSVRTHPSLGSAVLQYKCRQYRWFASASPKRWIITTSVCVVTLITAAALLNLGGRATGRGVSNALSLSFGTLNLDATLQYLNTRSIVGLVLLANSPQILLSFLYFAYNSLYTCMLLADDWSGYARERKPLRVTSQSGEQRSTYRLQLPYCYGIPLLIVSAVLHWLVSQSIFVVFVQSYGTDGAFNGNPDGDAAIYTCGFSPSAILTTIIVGSVVLCLGIANGFRQYKPGIPLAGSCSAAISAACHPPPGDEGASQKALLWGSCGHLDRDGKRREEDDQRRDEIQVGHCSLTSFVAERPVEGVMYAG